MIWGCSKDWPPSWEPVESFESGPPRCPDEVPGEKEVGDMWFPALTSGLELRRPFRREWEETAFPWGIRLRVQQALACWVASGSAVGLSTSLAGHCLLHAVMICGFSRKMATAGWAAWLCWPVKTACPRAHRFCPWGSCALEPGGNWSS